MSLLARYIIGLLVAVLSAEEKRFSLGVGYGYTKANVLYVICQSAI